ncbi:MAG: hypothetical protein D6763_01030 [Alphaproteobacteria bacterium]|nr:MAG: hypothetical protein D6763_01030 [Alphaproteobacteria bacterium]
MVFGLANGGSGGASFQLVQFDTSLLGAFYEAQSFLRASATLPAIPASTRGPAVEAPWELDEDTRSLERRVNEVRNIDKFIDERSAESKLAGDDRDAKALFTLYRALTKLKAIAEYAAEANTTDSSRRPLDTLLARGLGEIRAYVAEADLDKLDLLYGTKSSRVESQVRLGKDESKVVGAVIQTGAKDDPLPGVTGTEIFTVSITKSGVTQDIEIDLSNISGPITLQALVDYANSQISAIQATDEQGNPLFDADGNPVARYAARFTIEEVSDEGYALAISGLTAETVSLSAAAVEPSLFLAGTTRAIGAGRPAAATFTRLDGIDSADPNAAVRQQFSGTGTPIQQVPEADDSEDLTSGRTNAVVDEIRKQVADLFTELDLGDEEDPLTRPSVETAATAVAVDSQGHVFVIGTTEGDLGNQINRAEGTDVYLSKYDASGNLIWQRLLGASGTAEGYGIAIDSQDNVIVAGKVDGTLDGSELYDGADSFVVKFDNSGDRLWTQQLDSLASDAATAIAVDSNDDIYISGYTSGRFAAGHVHGGGRDAFLARLSADDGSVAASTQYGGAADETARAVTVASDGGVLVAAEEGGREVLRKFDPADLTSEIWSLDLGDLQGGAITAIAEEAGAIYVAGYSGNTSLAGTVAVAHQGQQDGFVTRIDDAGASASAAWTSYVGTGTGDFIEDIAVSAGNVYVAGRTAGDLGGSKSGVTDTFAAKLDGTDGSHLWIEQLGGATGFNGAAGLAFSSRGSSVLTALGLGPGTLQTKQTRNVETQTTLRDGDHFYIAINGGTKRKITIREGDTFAKIASRINRLSFQYIKAEASFSSAGNGLKISVNNGSTVQIFAGDGDRNALPSLGIEPTKIFPTDKIFKLGEEKESEELGGVFGLKFEVGLSLSTERAAKFALGQINDAIAEVQRAYRSLSVNPLAELLKQQAAIESGTVPPHLQAQLANYQNGLTRLVAGGGAAGLFV